MTAPTIGVLTPVGRDMPRHFLERACASVARQSYPNVLHFVREDTDAEGIPVLLNRMLAQYEADIDAWFCMGADDTMSEDCLAAHVEAWLAHGRKPHMVYGRILGVDEAGQPLLGCVPFRHRYDRAELLAGKPQLPSAALHDIRLWHLVGGYDEQLVHGREDWAWFVKAARLLPDFWPLGIDHLGYFHTKRAGSLTSNLKHYQDEFLAGLRRAQGAV
jgi:hypothetical protein